MLISLSNFFPVSRKTMSQPTERPRQFSLRLHQHRILFGGYQLFPTLKEGPRNIMASGSQLWSSQSSDLLTFMDFRHFYGHVDKILFAEFILNTFFFIAYCLLQKLNLGPKNNFDKGFPLW